MSKVQRHQNDLRVLFSELLETGDESNLIQYLLSNSNLPSRRANLELAKAFIMVLEEYWEKEETLFWKFITTQLELNPDQAPTNDPLEFLPFCCTWALGSIGTTSEVYFKESIHFLKQLANDSRWRIREAVAKGIYKLNKVKGQLMLKELQTWIVKNQWLKMRAVVTGVAGPSLLQDEKTAKQALEFHKEVFNQIQASKDRESEEFKVLRKGLSYSLSVVVQAIPTDGFDYLEELVSFQDDDILYVVKQNLKKNRLLKKYPLKVKNVRNLLK